MGAQTASKERERRHDILKLVFGDMRLINLECCWIIAAAQLSRLADLGA
jgi:hypothetical protein